MGERVGVFLHSIADEGQGADLKQLGLALGVDEDFTDLGMAHSTVDLFHQSGEMIGPRDPLGGWTPIEAAVVDQLDRKPADRFDLLEHLGLKLAGHLPGRAPAGGSVESEDEPSRSDTRAVLSDTGKIRVGFAASSDRSGRIAEIQGV